MVATGPPGRVEPRETSLRWRVAFPEVEHAAASSHMRELAASDCRPATIRSYAYALLRWFRFLQKRFVQGARGKHRRVRVRGAPAEGPEPAMAALQPELHANNTGKFTILEGLDLLLHHRVTRARPNPTELDYFGRTLAAFGTYAAGFVARPLGRLIAGHFGARVGRRPCSWTAVVPMEAVTVGIDGRARLPAARSPSAVWLAMSLSPIRTTPGARG